jgi:predicted ribosomally synthesized peptide with SipW-like signal peptide
MKDKVEISVKKIILLSVIMVTITAALVGVGTYAFFSASAVTTNNTFSTGSISFAVNGQDPWTTNFNATLFNLAPNQTAWGNVSILNTGTLPADVWVMINNDYGYNNTGTANDTAKNADNTNGQYLVINGTITYGLWSNVSGSFAKMFPSASEPMYTISNGSHQFNGTVSIPGYMVSNITHNNWTYIGSLTSGSEWMVNQSFTLDSNTTNWAQLTNMSFSVNFYALQTGVPAGAQPSPQTPGHAHP